MKVCKHFLRSTDDLTIIAYDDIENQLTNEELGVGTSTLLLLAEFQYEVKGTPIETRFFSSIRLFKSKYACKAGHIAIKC